MTDNEKVANAPTEKKTERVFVLGIGRGPKMRTIRFVIAPVEKIIEKDDKEKTHQEEVTANKKEEDNH